MACRSTHEPLDGGKFKGAGELPNGRHGDNPLSDLVAHGAHPFPLDIEKTLLEINAIGRRLGRWPLGENWPYSPREVEWERGRGLVEARRLLAHLLAMLESGRGDEILLDPKSGRPLSEG